MSEKPWSRKALGRVSHLSATGKIIEQTVQRASLIGHVIEDLVYERIEPSRFKAELNSHQKLPQYKQDGFFVFSDLRNGNYTLKVTGERLQPVTLDVPIQQSAAGPDAVPSPIFIPSRGDNELIVIVRGEENSGSNTNEKRITFDPVILTKAIHAGADVVLSGASTKLTATLDAGVVSSARVESINGIVQGAIVRIIRENSIRLKYDPYYLFASPITQVVGKVTLQQNPAIQLAGARVRVTKINDAAVIMNNVGGVEVFTGVDVSNNTVVLGVEKDISAVTNEKGDYNLYFSNEMLSSLKITDQTLTNLASVDVPDEVRTRLESLKDRNFRGRERFLAALRETINEEDFRKYGVMIQKEAENFIRNLTLETILEGYETAFTSKLIESGRRNAIDVDLVRN